MLSVLHLENIAIIKRADISFDSGFTVMTGETGAGKSIIIDSVNLLMGGRFSREIIRSGESTALVSAIFSELCGDVVSELEKLDVFPEDDGCVYVQRTMHIDGKTQARINGVPVPVSTLRAAVSELITIHGQHDNQQLLDPDKHIFFLDRFSEGGDALKKYSEAYLRLSGIREKLIRITRDTKESARMAEMLKYQISEIDNAKLKSGETEKLEAERRRIRDLEKISTGTSLIYSSLYRNEGGESAYNLVQKSVEALSSLKEYIPEAGDYIERLESFSYDIEDIALSVNALCDDIPEDPTAHLDRIESRLAAIEKLKHKYGSDIEEILSFRNKAAAELEELEVSDDTIKKLKKEYISAEKDALSAAEELHNIRIEAAKQMEAQVLEELKFLDMGKVSFKVSFEPETTGSGAVKFTKNGTDRIEFLISTNTGEPLKPLSKIASGGELSRIMLAIKSITARRDMVPTLIFDEVDTGVSGKTSQRIGVKLRGISEFSQVICVTHSAQIAAVAHNHMKIEKSEQDGRVTTSVHALDRQQRTLELARIMGGANITDKLIETAGELLDEYNGTEK